MAAFPFPSTVFAFMNLKGGTGKTTVAIAISEALCHLLRKKVLIVDCDFQCSASIALLGRARLNELIATGRTFDQAILQAMSGPRPIDLGACIVPAGRAVVEARELSILPASPSMPRTERAILAQCLAGEGLHVAYQRASTAIAGAVRALTHQHDAVVLDCPPGITLFSEAAMRACDFLIVPTLPNEISMAAIEHLQREVDDILGRSGFHDLHLATVVSKVRHRNALEHHARQIDSIQALLDRMPARFSIARPYLPFCRELENATWREQPVQRRTFAGCYGPVGRAVEELTLSLANRAIVQTRSAPTAA